MTQQLPTRAKVKFATQLAPDVLEALRAMSAREGRHLQSLLDEALREYLASRETGRPRRHVLNALHDSMAEHDSLYAALSQ